MRLASFIRSTSMPYLTATRIISLIFFELFLSCAVYGLRNVTVDDQNSTIIYSPAGSWYHIQDPSTFDIDGGHMLTSDPAASATFNFTGVAIYFLSALWPYTVNTAVTLDQGPIILLDLVDHNHNDTGGGPPTVTSHVIARAVGLANIQHTLRISVGSGQTFALVDALMYTALSDGETAPSSTTSNPPNQLTPVPLVPSAVPSAVQASTKSSKRHKLAIALPIVALLLLLIIGLLIWWFCARKRRTRPQSYLHRTSVLHDEPADHNMNNEEKDLFPSTQDPPAADVDVDSPPPTTQLHSPGRFYGALRGMPQSPTRAYPVRSLRVDSAVESAPSQYSQATYTPNRGSVPEPWEDRRSRARSSNVQVDGDGSVLFAGAPPEAHVRDTAARKSRRLGRESAVPEGEDRWAYPKAPLAYVPVLKS
ncbi:hypothetical protein BDZ97DRAFT_1112854 [Flammula alnicola]|nr:hypothetical protein BDZ97DRAFT_1112854 [Flammula alnicola]